MPIYIAKEPPKLKLPDDWNGTKETWPLFKMKVEMACQKVNMTFLTTATETTDFTADASKKVVEALHETAPQTALADFLGSARDFYRTRGIEMFQHLRQINEPTHPNAVSGIIEQLSSIRMKPSETPSAFKLRVELLNERLPAEVAYTPALLAHAAYKGLDKTRYSSFMENIRNGNKRIESLSSLFIDIEAFDNLTINESSILDPVLKSGSAKKVTFSDQQNSSSTPSSATQSSSSGDTSVPFDWKGQKDLSTNQVGWLLKKFYKGCVVCRTNTHEFSACPVLKDKFSVKRIKSSSRPSETGSARAASATVTPDSTSTSNDTTTATSAETQGKFNASFTMHSVSTAGPVKTSLSPSTTSVQHHLTSVSSPLQANHLRTESDRIDDIAQWSSL
jgi:hypothetical protein